MLRFLVDEPSGGTVAGFLVSQGHDVVTVWDVMPQAQDVDILVCALREARIVVTNDKDFGELVFRSGQGHAGVLLFRLDDESAANRLRMARMTIERYGSRLAGSFTVVTERTIRLRPMS